MRQRRKALKMSMRRDQSIAQLDRKIGGIQSDLAKRELGGKLTTNEYIRKTRRAWKLAIQRDQLIRERNRGFV